MSNSTWLGSLDVTSFVKNMMQRQTINIDKGTQRQLNQLTATQAGLNSQISVFAQLQGLITTLQTNVTQAVAAFTPTYSVSSSNPDAIEAQLIDGSDLNAVTHQVAVTTLAQAETYSSNNFSSTATPGAETLQISVAGVNFSVGVGASDTLQTIAANINAAAVSNSAAVTASVVTTGNNQYQLVITSNNTGTADAVTVTEEGGTNLNLTEKLHATNAVFTFDGISYSLQSNSNIEVQGLTIDLFNTGTNYLTVSANNSTSNITSAVQQVLDSYNQIVTLIEQIQAMPLSIADADGNRVTVARDNGNLSPILSQLQSTMNELFTGNAYESLSSIGIVAAPAKAVQIQKANGEVGTTYITGLLQIDSSSTAPITLSAALADNFSAVESLLTDSTHGIFTNLNELIDPNLGEIPQAIQTAETTVSHSATHVSRQIEDVRAKADALKKELLVKYAQLEVSISSMQSISVYLSQQALAMTRK